MATFTIATSGTDPITIQSQQDTAGDGIFADKVGETGTNLTVDDGSVNSYRANVSIACGAETSNVVQVVTQVPPEATILDNQGVTFTGFGYKGLIITDDSDTIIWNYRGYGPLRKSTDGGASFFSVNLRQQNSGEILVRMARGTGNRLWMFPYYNQNRTLRSEYSDDYYATAGTVWNATNTPFGNGLDFSYAHGILVEGSEFHHLNAQTLPGGDAKFIRHDDAPTLGNAIEDSAG